MTKCWLSPSLLLALPYISRVRCALVVHLISRRSSSSLLISPAARIVMNSSVSFFPGEVYNHSRHRRQDKREKGKNCSECSPASALCSGHSKRWPPCARDVVHKKRCLPLLYDTQPSSGRVHRRHGRKPPPAREDWDGGQCAHAPNAEARSPRCRSKQPSHVQAWTTAVYREKPGPCVQHAARLGW